MDSNLITTHAFVTLDEATSFLSGQNPSGKIAIVVILGHPLTDTEAITFGKQLAGMNCGYIIIHGESASRLELTIDEEYVTACIDGLQEPEEGTFITLCADDEDIDFWPQWCVERNEFSNIYILKIGGDGK
ncbi:MAG: hypothetical protein KDA68_19705 [Planctomycetaceae bacterium]|nr:hypothetical protein [Planctomycetaceae bacterium]